jgi:hypothetical protein
MKPDSATAMEGLLRLHILGGGPDTKPGEYLYLGNYKLRELQNTEIIKSWRREILAKNI